MACDENANWRIIKFKNINFSEKRKVLDTQEDYELALTRLGDNLFRVKIGAVRPVTSWSQDDGTYFKSVYHWEIQGQPNTPIIDPQTGQITDWNLKQQNNFNTNDEIKVTVKNKDISENPIYQLEANYFNWLSLTNELETNNIPSLIPSEIKLSDGEYGKYLTNLIISNEKIEDYLNYFSQWYRLLYSKAVWTSMINFTEKEQININNLELFSKNNEKLSLIRLEI